MIKYLQNKFALSKQGSKDLAKATVCCALTDISLMLPVGILIMFLKEIVKPIWGGTSNPNIWFYIGISGAMLILMFVLYYIQYNVTFLASYTESATKRISLAEHLRKLPLSFFGKRDLSDLTTTIISDCAGLETAFSHFIPQLFGSSISLVFVSIGLFAMNLQMSVALLWVVPVSFLIMFLGKKVIEETNAKNKEAQLQRAENIQECIETVKEIKANNKTKEYLETFDKRLLEGEKTTIKSEICNGIIVNGAQMVLRVGIATLVLVGGSMLINGEIDFFTFLIFLIAASRIFEPLCSSLINLSAIILTMFQVDRMKEIENQKIQTGNENVSYNGYDINFNHVEFSYGNDEAVLKDVSFTAKQGEITAIIGPSGGGKSTAAKLAARFWDIQNGNITLGGTDISKVDPELLMKNYSIVFQDVTLFNNTVIENIRLGKKDATDDEVIAAAKAAQCEEFINKMPKGYQSLIGENGSILSGGERQRLSIARALLKDAPVVLLDEATASLDVENETLIQEAISRLVKNKTVLVIAHRMRTIAGADKIIVLSDGVVAEQGNPSALFENGKIYRHMLELQMKSATWSL